MGQNGGGVSQNGEAAERSGNRGVYLMDVQVPDVLDHNRRELLILWQVPTPVNTCI